MDMRGHGRSSKMLDGYSIDRMAKDIHEVIEYLGLKDVLLMGWSMGGPTMPLLLEAVQEKTAAIWLVLDLLI